MQAAEMIAGVSGAGGRIVEAEEGLVFARKHSLHVREDLVAKLCTVDVSAEPGQLVASPPPAHHECFACHGRARIAWCSLSQRRLPVSPEVTAPSCHSVLPDLGGRSQPSASLQWSRTEQFTQRCTTE